MRRFTMTTIWLLIFAFVLATMPGQVWYGHRGLNLHEPRRQHQGPGAESGAGREPRGYFDHSQ